MDKVDEVGPEVVFDADAEKWLEEREGRERKGKVEYLVEELSGKGQVHLIGGPSGGEQDKFDVPAL